MYFTAVTGDIPDATLAGVTKVQHLWHLRRNDNPLEVQIIGCEPEIDLEWAHKALFSAASAL